MKKIHVPVGPEVFDNGNEPDWGVEGGGGIGGGPISCCWEVGGGIPGG